MRKAAPTEALAPEPQTPVADPSVAAVGPVTETTPDTTAPASTAPASTAPATASAAATPPMTAKPGVRRSPAAKKPVAAKATAVPVAAPAAEKKPAKRTRAAKPPLSEAPVHGDPLAAQVASPVPSSSQAETATSDRESAVPIESPSPIVAQVEPDVRPQEPAPAASTAPVVTPQLPQAVPATDRLSILIVTSEMHPFATTGGLAEVVAALPRALAASGHDVTIVLPQYRGVDATGASETALSFSMGARPMSLSVRERMLENGVRLALVDAPDLFDRDGLYGDANGDYPDNAWRFAVFSRAALEYARAKGIRPSIIHVHDWPSGLVPVYQKMLFSTDPIVGGVPVVFTIHNLAFQGLFPASTVEAIGLGWEVLDLQAMEYWGQVSYLKAGINFSETITTVSPTYASEITSPELGFGFDGILRRRALALVGILNGIDTERWNPAADAYVPTTFTADDLSGKQAAKRALLEAAGLASDARAMARPVIGLLSRLTDQKGFDLIAAAADELMSLDASWVMLGSGDHRHEELWRTLAARNSGRVAATIGFDERLAHLIHAGSDLFLMPSRFEPCGLNQMYSLRYGTLPIVRSTGGLKDTVEDAGRAGSGTGFVFGQYTPGALVDAIRRALTAYRNADLWRGMQRRAMQQDHSWDASAREYVKVYRALTAEALERSSAPAVSAAPTDR